MNQTSACFQLVSPSNQYLDKSLIMFSIYFNNYIVNQRLLLADIVEILVV